MDRVMRPAKRLATAVGVDGQARWLWSHRLGGAKDRRFAQWLADRDEADNHRIRLILASVLSEDSNCVDIGAAEGHMLADMVRLAPSGSHLAYEPLPEPAARLAAEYPNVDVRRKAVTNEAGELGFVHVVNGSGWSGLREYEFGIAAEVEHVMVEAVRLDDDLPEGYCPSFIKVDVNGAEIELFEGAIRTLSTARPYVLFEHGIACRAFGHVPGDVYPVLEQCGLRLFDLDGNGPLTKSDFQRALNDEAKWNFLARA